MPIISLQARNVRLFERLHVEFGERLNVIVGPNAGGKTSLLEAIHLLAVGRSFRSARVNPVIRKGADQIVLVGRYLEAASGVVTTLGLERGRSGYEVKIDGRAETRLAALAKAFPVLAITPDTHYGFENSAKQRRATIDWSLFHVEQRFFPAWLKYRRLLRQRNALLRDRTQHATLATWDAGLVGVAEEIQGYRQGHLQAWDGALGRYGKELLGETGLTLTLKSGWRQGMALSDVLRLDRERDTEEGFTHAGPHRADLTLCFDGQPIKDVASHGQKKLALIALKLAQIHLFIEHTGRTPTLLLDDLTAELDQEHCARLLVVLARLPVQVFVTATAFDAPLSTAWTEFRLFHVKHGDVAPSESASR